MKKCFAILLSLVLLLSLAVPAMAADITITGGASNSEYAAYKLLNATHNPGDASDKEDDLFAYTLNSKYTSILQSETDKTEQADIIDYIQELDSEGIRDFADAVYAAIKEANPTIEADYTAADNVFEDVDQGYYLIAETKLGAANEDGSDTFSLVMLDTAGLEDIEVNTKEDTPSVDKYIVTGYTLNGPPELDTIDDGRINSHFNYRIIGTVSSKYADYKSYDYTISDTMDKGLTYWNDAKVYVVNGEAWTNVTDQFVITTTTNSETGNNNGFTASANLKALTLPEGVSITETTTILVTYSARLNKYAVSGTQGNQNEVILKYENDPYVEADGKTGGETPPSEAKVLTYNLIIDKVDQDGNSLEGAGFTLYKESLHTVKSGGVESLLPLPDDSWQEPPKDDKPELTWGDYWEKVSEQGTGESIFTFTGLGSDTRYWLDESIVPAGYNKMDHIVFSIRSTMTNGELEKLEVVDDEGNPIPGFSVEIDETEIAIKITVVNQAGAVLPETGGIGTTIFYVVGGLMAVGAVILLVTKKRMGREDT